MRQELLFQIEAITHAGETAINSRTYSFFRPYTAKTPTRRGAARMVAKFRTAGGLPTKPADVAVIRIQANVHRTI